MCERPVFDERDQQRVNELLPQWDAIKGPRVGDYVRFPDGLLARFTHDWGNGLQTTCYRKEHPCYGDERFYWSGSYVSFSGSLDPTIPLSRIKEYNGEKIEGSFWFFHHNHVKAHNGVSFKLPCRVYEVRDE